ncbi:ATP-binding protein [Luteolibacter sp. SL250]|uniref:sensor histidine kinase n=1 Tax=Luteolibacter sp. SL250 TaxID=2995170 RepID=UPI00226E5847|nr:ATP-binding protein [Luteolibacter sp. SL250]WAC19042.1 ATP-binding protein [Luteolibacter sp. SL250]
MANAITHGSRDQPITVTGEVQESEFELAVENSGNRIPDDLVPILFQPFAREKASASMNGLGLGLYIASEIARTHDGSLTVDSSAEKTSFRLRMPLLAGEKPGM